MDNFFEFRSDIRVSTAKNQDGVRFFTIKWFWAHRLQTVDLTRVSLLYILFLRSIGIFYCTNFFFQDFYFRSQRSSKFQKGVVHPFWRVVFFNFCKLGGSNQKMLVSNLEELKKIGEVCFGVLSIALIVSEKIGFLRKIRENFSFGCRTVAPMKKMMYLKKY